MAELFDYIRPFVYIALSACAAWIAYTALKTGVYSAFNRTRRDTQPVGYWIGVITIMVGGLYLFGYGFYILFERYFE